MVNEQFHYQFSGGMHVSTSINRCQPTFHNVDASLVPELSGTLYVLVPETETQD
jgi:hypothetical protein